MPVIARYAIATLAPLALLLLGGLVWGGFAVLALIWLTLVAAIGDQILQPPAPDPEGDTRWATRLSVALAIGHFALLAVTLAALSAAGLTFGQGLALFFGTASFFGQVSHPNAHDLIHRAPRPLRMLGAAVYISVGFGHHVSAHRLVHHAHVGTDADPNTPLPGESFYAYLPRAWRGSFEAGLEVEIDRLDQQGRPEKSPHNPYWIWIGGALLALIAASVLGGIGGVLLFVGLAALTGAQILMSDYLQHYGLQRLLLPNGRYEPVGPHHSWNAPRGFSSYLMLNAPSHSEHHMHPGRSFDALAPDAPGPVLPYPMPIMAVLAMIPSVWHGIMDKRAVRVTEAAEADRLRPKAPTPSDQRQTTSPQPCAKPAAEPSPPIPRADAEPSPEAAAEDSDALMARVQKAIS
ncbi:fatty acid desaturase [Gymnodinialimonas sp. 2305UL16-5]|uniref:alkane 1-monooxygenase n=1 Tax=Gymnodinialimonas mytili TaxID=3126503 RepID=UPI0030A88A78